MFEILDEAGKETQFYVIPLYGFGLWNNIFGFVSLEKDMSTIKGIKLGHKGETPGLGARIADEEIQKRFVGKKIFDNTNTLKSVMIQKGEQGGGERSINAFKDKAHEIDGLSGATITAKGVNNMLEDYFKCYEKFFKTKISGKVALN